MIYKKPLAAGIIVTLSILATTTTPAFASDRIFTADEINTGGATSTNVKINFKTPEELNITPEVIAEGLRKTHGFIYGINVIYRDPSQLYFANDNGDPLTGWQKGLGGWIYCDSVGKLAREEWKQIDGEWYFFDYRGVMLSDCSVDGFHVGKDGKYDGVARGDRNYTKASIDFSNGFEGGLTISRADFEKGIKEGKIKAKLSEAVTIGATEKGTGAVNYYYVK